MEVILLERVGKLGQMGDVVRVKDGFRTKLLVATRQGTSRHGRQQEAVRRDEIRTSGAQS